MTDRTGDTRARIQDVALEMFAEQGYEATSLREIAHQLGVTKAAVYYHFRSKEEIVQSIVADRVANLDEIIAWARALPPGRDTRRAVLRRYADDLFHTPHRRLMRFFERNQPALNGMAAGQQIRQRMMDLLAVLRDEHSTPADELRTALALFAMQTAWIALIRPELTDEERRAVALEVAYELIDPRGPAPADDPLIALLADTSADELLLPPVDGGVPAGGPGAVPAGGYGAAGRASRSPTSSTPGAGDQSSSGARTKPSRA
ncbi:MAG TPA: helix-turn-helix domain-containing protein [Pilimelia sp.]|nr:helix-turn-helix domain-containing protein [Pilimelia sp.]